MAALQRIVGHSSIQITAQYYLHVSPEAHADTLRALEALDGTPSGCAEIASKMRVELVGEGKPAVSV